MSKLKRIHVIIIGCVACALVVAGLYFLVIKDATKRITDLNTQLQNFTEVANRRSGDERKLLDVKNEFNRQMADYSHFMRAKMPALSFADRPQGMIALWKEQSEVLGPMLKSWPTKTGVKLLSGVSVPGAPSDPNAVTGGCISLPIGTFQVQGDFHSIMNHIRRWNNFGRLVVVGPATINGPSPGMTASYDVTVLLVPSGPAGPTFQMGSGAAVASNSATAGAATPAPAAGTTGTVQ